MTASRPDNEAIFHAALDVPDPERRRAYVREACRGDEARIAHVEALLAAADAPDSLLDRPAESHAAATIDPSTTEGPGTVIGPYKLLEQIGEGGFGVVFLAEQSRPVRRRVALKVLKPGMDTRQVVARFEVERQALALMDHPNIAKVFDGGATPSGRPYFVMELVRGVPITEFCDQNHLTPRQRLELFISVCQAVQHAHQKGIIHRDIKPSNALVSRHDSTPVVKVIDFGVAKALGQELTDKTLFTGITQMVGTPLYMSPEQAGMSDLDVDTRSDIYSLGVLLYELLTGTTPFSRQRFKQSAYDEIRRIIREEEPPPPSTRLSTTEELPSIAANRGLESKKLSGVVRGELDWIVMKALEKDRRRRYETANGFAQDIERYLADEPVQACPPSAAYRLRKFIRRNRARLAVAGVVLACLVFLGAGAGWVARDRAVREARLEDAVARALDEAAESYRRDQLPEALAAVRRAEELLAGGGGGEQLKQRVCRWRADLDMVNRLEEAMLERSAIGYRYIDWAQADQVYRDAFCGYGLDVEEADPEVMGERIRDAAVRDRLVVALDDWLLVKGIGARPGGDRLLAAVRRADPEPWRDRVRDAFWRRDDQAVRDLARGKEALTQPPASALLLGMAISRTGEPLKAVEVLRLAQRRYPADFWINFYLGLHGVRELKPTPVGMEEVIGCLRTALAVRPQCAFVHFELARALRIQGRTDDAEAAFREAIRLKPDFAWACNEFGDFLYRQDRLDEAEAEVREALRIKPDFGDAHGTFGELLYRRGNRFDAAAKFRETIGLEDDPDTLFTSAAFLLLAGDSAGYRAACARALDRYGRFKWPRAVYLTARLSVLGPGATDDPGQAIRLAERAVDSEPRVAWYLHTLGLAFYRAGRFDEAIRRLHESMDCDPDWPAHVVNWMVLAMAHHRLGQPEEARRWLGRAVEWIDHNIPERPDESPTALPGLHSQDGLACRILRREVEALLKAQDGKDK